MFGQCYKFYVEKIKTSIKLKPKFSKELLENLIKGYEENDKTIELSTEQKEGILKILRKYNIVIYQIKNIYDVLIRKRLVKPFI